MIEHRTPDEMTTENELICEKLLGWKRCSMSECSGFIDSDGDHHYDETFTSWADAGLILAELDERDVDVEIGNGIKDGAGGWYCRITGMRLNDSPFCRSAAEAVRAAALTYIRSLP